MLEDIVRKKAENLFKSSGKADTPVTDKDRDGECKLGLNS
jgi:hypothetical protein